MKTAQDCKPGQIVKMDGALFVVRDWKPYKKGDRGGIIIDMKFQNIETGAVVLRSPRAQDQFDDVTLDRHKMQFLYENQGMYTFMNLETFDQMDLTKELLGEYLPYLKEQMEVDVFYHDGRPISLDFPTFAEMEITYTENVVKGDTSGKVMKKAKLDSGFEIDVPSFCNIGDKIKIDTRTHEYVERVK